MLLYLMAYLLRNTVQVYILNKQMSHADSEHELKCVLIVYALMHFNLVKTLSQNRVEVRISKQYVNHADIF